MNLYGFKTITIANWLEVDPIHNSFVTFDKNLAIRPQEVADRLNRILEPHLHTSVPREVRRLYEVARGALVYGNLFYPLYACRWPEYIARA